MKKMSSRHRVMVVATILVEWVLLDFYGHPIRKQVVGARINRNMSKSKGWTLQSSLLMLWMEKTLVNNQTTIDDK